MTKMPPQVLEYLDLQADSIPTIQYQGTGEEIEIVVHHVDMHIGCMYWTPKDMSHWDALSADFDVVTQGQHND